MSCITSARGGIFITANDGAVKIRPRYIFIFFSSFKDEPLILRRGHNGELLSSAIRFSVDESPGSPRLQRGNSIFTVRKRTARFSVRTHERMNNQLAGGHKYTGRIRSRRVCFFFFFWFYQTSPTRSEFWLFTVNVSGRQRKTSSLLRNIIAKRFVLLLVRGRIICSATQSVRTNVGDCPLRRNAGRSYFVYSEFTTRRTQSFVLLRLAST